MYHWYISIYLVGSLLFTNWILSPFTFIDATVIRIVFIVMIIYYVRIADIAVLLHDNIVTYKTYRNADGCASCPHL